jgi:hypothetical protein
MAGSTRQSREHKKWLAARRAQFRLKQQFEYIDFVEDVLNPESEALLSGKVRLEIEASSQDAAESIIRVHVEGEDAAHSSTAS